MRAFIGEPADANGEALPCTYCDRRSRGRAGPNKEPRCMRHLSGTLTREQQYQVDAARRERLKASFERR